MKEYEVEIFRAGRHTDNAGQAREWTERDLDQVVSSYDPKLHEAPVVVGHPANDAPAYGWVRGLRRAGERLLAKMELVPEFVEALRQKLYKKRSAAFYADLNGKGLYLRHVGFLGAAPPAVKGLTDATFAEGEALVVEFSDDLGWALRDMAEIARGWREYLIAEKGLDVADQVIPSWRIDNLMAAAERATESNAYNERGARAPKEEKQMSEPKGALGRLVAWLKGRNVQFQEAEVAGLLEEPAATSYSEADVKAREEAAEKRGREAVEKELARKARQTEINAFCETRLKAGKLAPAWFKAGLKEFMEALAADGTFEFGEATDRKKLSPAAWFTQFLEGLPAIISFKELAPGSTDAGEGEDAEKREQLVNQFMEANKEATYKQATLAVAKKHPELFGIERR